MAEPKLRFTQDNGERYPDLAHLTMGDIYTERNDRGDPSLPVLTVSIHSGVSDGELDEDELGKRVKRSSDLSQYKKAVSGDLVFNMMRAWQGAVGCVKTTGLTSPAYIVAKPNEMVYPPYMDYYVQTKNVIDKFNRLSYGALDFRKRLYWDSFITADINIPVLEEQKKIADFLTTVDEVIAASDAEVINLEIQKKAVMKKILTQEIRFTRSNSSDFPQWDETTLGKIANIVGGGTPDTENKAYWEDGKYNWFTPAEVGNTKYVYKSKRMISALGLEKSSAKLLPKGALLLSSRATVGEMSIAGNECCTNQGFQSLIIHDDVDAMFIYYNQPIIKAYAMKNAAGSTFLEISGKNLAECPLKLPCIEEQRLIADFLSDFDDAIAAAKRELELWKQLKKGLLQQLFV